MLKAYLLAYPWDLIDEDVAAVLDRLHGDVGITGVALWVACPSLIQIRARDVEPRIVRTRGGVLFAPEERHYTGTRCRPVVSSRVKGRCPIEQVGGACTERSMSLRVVISASMIGRLAQRHPEMATRNVFGAPSERALCPVHPDARALVSGLVADLSTRDHVAGIVLTDFDFVWPEAFAPDLAVGVPLGRTEQALLATCFCESCEQAAVDAGVDVESARGAASTILHCSFETGVMTDGSIEAILSDHEPLAAYYRQRCEALSSWLRQLTGTCPCGIALQRCLTEPMPGTDPGLDFGSAAAVLTRIDHPNELGAAFLSTARSNELVVPAAIAVGASGPELVGMFSRAVDLGFAGVTIDHYGVLPDAAMTPVKQAIRLARRASRE